MLDYDMLAAKSGFWSGYYSMSKKPKPLNVILEQLYKQYKGIEVQKKRKHADDVDVEAFLQREAEFQARLSEMEK